MTLRTQLSVEECKARLSSAVDAEKFAFECSGYAGSKEILGRIRDTSFRLQKRRYYRNSFAPFFYGRLIAADGCTVIEGKFSMRPFTKVFWIAWCSFLALFIVMMVISVFTGKAVIQDRPALALLIPAGMAAGGVAILKFGQWLGRSEERSIVAFIKSTLEANEDG